jgi:hypothetical protein
MQEISIKPCAVPLQVNYTRSSKTLPYQTANRINRKRDSRRYVCLLLTQRSARRPRENHIMPNAHTYIKLIESTDDPTQRMIRGHGILQGRLGFQVDRPETGRIHVSHTFTSMTHRYAPLIEYVADISYKRQFVCPGADCKAMFYFEDFLSFWTCERDGCFYHVNPVLHTDAIWYLDQVRSIDEELRARALAHRRYGRAVHATTSRLIATAG